MLIVRVRLAAVFLVVASLFASPSYGDDPKSTALTPMTKAEKDEAVKEWASVRKSHPKFARAYLAQQLMLMEAVRSGDVRIAWGMCEWLEDQAVYTRLVVFYEFWRTQCAVVIPRPGGIVDCLRKAKDPADCFPSDDDWFDDPFAGGRTLPPKGPVPPLTPPR